MLMGEKIQLPASERGWSDADLKRVDRLRAKLARTDLKEKQREKTEQELAALLASPTVAAERAWREQMAAETVALAKGRGEEVERTLSRIRVHSRDPLLSLIRAGHLTAEQYDTGIMVRDLYERRHEGLGSQMGGLGGTSSPTYDNSPAVFQGLQRAKALQKIGRIEREVALSAKDEHGRGDPNALAMLRAVCGEGKSLSSQGEGRAFERNARSLARALDLAAELR